MKIALFLGVTAALANRADAQAPSAPNSIAQIASAGGWDTSLTLVNFSASPADAALSFFDESGNPLSLPLSFPQGALSTTNASKLTTTVNAHGLLLMDTKGPVNHAANVGWSLLHTGGKVGGYAVFTNTVSNWQAAVPIETRNASSYLLAFDNTGSLSTGLAIANLSPLAANINVTIRNDSGTALDTQVINVPPQGHTSFMLSSVYPSTAGIRGTIEFDTPAGGQINVLGLRANGPALTTVPVLAEVSANGGSMAHVTYNQGWQTTFTLVNTGASAAQATLSFYDDFGTALEMSMMFPQTGAVSSATTVTETLAAGASLIIETNGHDSFRAVTGSAQLTTTGNVSGFAIFRYSPSQQEAVVPLETRNASSYTVAFDNTNGIATGLALANESKQAATLNLILRTENGAQIAGGIVTLPAHGHKAMVLSQGYPPTAGIRGTVEIDVPANSQVSALGLRFTPSQNITTIPALAK